MPLKFGAATRKSAKLKIGIGGPSGSGKTMSALLMAYGMMKEAYPNLPDDEIWAKICIIDTENESGSLYTNMQVGATHIGTYNAINLEPPFEAESYINAIKLAEQNDQEVLIIDSISHAWAGEGGALERQSNIASRTGNSYTAWKEPKKDMNKMMNAILQSKCHIICNIRAKTEYAQEKDSKGKTIVRNLGMGLITQSESQYEYTVLLMLDNAHTATAEKDRTALFDGKYFVVTPDTGRSLYRWLLESKPEPPAELKEEEPKAAPNAKPKAEPKPETKPVDKAKLLKVNEAVTKLVKSGKRDETLAKVNEIIGREDGNYYAVTDGALIEKLFETFCA